MKKRFFLCLIAILAIFSIVSCAGDIKVQEDEKIPLVKSDNLDAWRNTCAEHSDFEHKDEAEVNVQVTGTVVTAPNKKDGTKYTYIADEEGVGLLIYGDYRGKIPYAVGDEVTLKINKIKYFGADFQTNDTNVQVISKKAGTRLEPTIINTQSEFNDLVNSNLAYVTFYGRVASDIEGGRTFQVNILTKAEYNELLKQPTLQEDEITPIADKVVTVYPYGNNKIAYGDICKFTGHVGIWHEAVQVKTYSEVEKGFERIQATPVDGTITDYVNTAKTGTKKLDAPLNITGIPTYIKTKDYREMIIVEPGTSNAISFYMPRDDYFKNIQLGKPVTLTVYNIDEAFGQIQCTSIGSLKQDTSAEADKTALHAGAKKVTSASEYATFGRYRDFLTIEGTVSAVDKKDYTIKLANNDTITVYISDKIATFAVNDSVSVYGNAGLYNGEPSFKVTDAIKK